MAAKRKKAAISSNTKGRGVVKKGPKKTKPKPRAAARSKVVKPKSRRPGRTRAPVAKAKKPAKPAKKPVKVVKPTKKPVKPTKKPVKPTKKPVKPTKKPVKPTKKPVKPTKKPVKPTKKPVKVVKPTKKPVKVVRPTKKPVKVVKPTKKPVKVVKPTKKPVKVEPSAPKRAANHEFGLKRARIYRRKLQQVAIPIPLPTIVTSYGYKDGTSDAKLTVDLSSLSTLSEVKQLVSTIDATSVSWPKGTCISMGFTIPPETLVSYNRKVSPDRRVDAKSYLRLRGKLGVASKWRTTVKRGGPKAKEAAVKIVNNIAKKFGIIPSDFWIKIHASPDGSCQRSSQ
jgi:hypothetical protein